VSSGRAGPDQGPSLILSHVGKLYSGKTVCNAFDRYHFDSSNDLLYDECFAE